LSFLERSFDFGRLAMFGLPLETEGRSRKIFGQPTGQRPEEETETAAPSSDEESPHSDSNEPMKIKIGNLKSLTAFQIAAPPSLVPSLAFPPVTPPPAPDWSPRVDSLGKDVLLLQGSTPPGLSPPGIQSLSGTAPSAETHQSGVCVLCSSEATRVSWTVNTKQLRNGNKVIVSPPFTLHFGHPLRFKLLLRRRPPQFGHAKRGGDCFKKAQGMGSVELKCEETVGESTDGRITLCASLKQQGHYRQGHPVAHDFAQEAVCALPRGELAADQWWNFEDAVDKDRQQMFVVHLEASQEPTF